MAKVSTGHRVVGLVLTLLYVLLIALWSLRMVSIRVLGGWAMIILGLQIAWSWRRVFGQPQWPVVLWGVGTCLIGLGVAMGTAATPIIAGGTMSFTALIAILVYSHHPSPVAPESPLVLTDEMRSRAGLSDGNEEQGPRLQLVLVNPGQKRVRAIRCLRLLYDLGLETAFSLVQESPSVLQTTTSRQEAEFVAAQLAECGAQVDIVEAQQSDT